MPRGPRITDKEKDTIRALKSDGVEVKLIMERTGRSVATIYKVLREKENAREDTPVAEQQ